jgi:hypothetical protein
MTDWAKRLGMDASTGALQTLRLFTLTSPTLDTETVRVEGDAWRIDGEDTGFFARLFKKGHSIPLFEVGQPAVDQCLLVYRAKIRTENLDGRAYLEMWSRLGGREHFSKGVGFDQAASGTTDWTTYETPFLLQSGEKPDLVKLNVAIEGSGTVWVKDVELLVAPLGAPASPAK